MSAARRRNSDTWWLDRRLSAGIIIAMLAQAGSIVWWAATKEQLDHFQQSRLEHIEVVTNRQSIEQGLMLERLARIEARGESLLELMRRIQEKLDMP
jgi:hypothetical protein